MKAITLHDILNMAMAFDVEVFVELDDGRSCGLRGVDVSYSADGGMRYVVLRAATGARSEGEAK